MPSGFQIGDTLGDYRITGILGSGGMGHVFKVEHAITGRAEALKVLLRDHSAEPQLAQRFLREIQLQASLNHPNIAAVYNAFTAGDNLVMVMELVEGASLDRILERGRLPLETALGYARQALDALAYAHGRGVTHRDIKPANIIVTPEGALKLTDFGLAKARTDATRLTRSGALVGSIHYISPEQVRAKPDIDARSDMYSFGVVLYEMVTGSKPFDSESGFEIMRAHVGQAPVPPIERNPALAPAVSDAVLKAMAKNPDDRFASAAGFREALSGGPAGARRPRRRDPSFTVSALRIALSALAFIFAGISVTPSRYIAVKAPGGLIKQPEPERPGAAPAKAAAASPSPIVLAAGTALKVCTTEMLSSRDNDTGETFAATLEEPLVVGSRLIAAKGAYLEGRIVEAEKGGRLKGRASLTLQLTRLHTSGGAVIGILTDPLRTEGAGVRAILIARGGPAIVTPDVPLTFRLERPAMIPLSAARNTKAALPADP